MHLTRPLRAAATAALALVLVVFPFVWWSPAAGVLLAVAATAAAAWLHRQRWVPAAFFGAFALAATWLLLFTWRGYYWAHAGELRALAAEVAAYPPIRSLEMGDDGEYTDRGRRVRFDSYRFLNGTVVTHYREQHQPGAHQPVWYIGEFCRRHGISRARYLQTRRALAHLRLQGFEVEPDGTVSFTLRNEGGDPVVTTLDYVPSDREPAYDGTRRVAPRWYVVRKG